MYAEDGKQAIKAVCERLKLHSKDPHRNPNFRLIISNYKMPFYNADEMYNEIKALYSDF